MPKPLPEPLSEPRVAHALFCDEVRSEPGGKMSFVGIHTQGIAVGIERRGGLFDFSVVAWLICDPDDVPAQVTLRVYGPPGRRLLTGSDVKLGAPQRRADSTKAYVQLTMPDISLPLSQEGDIECTLETDRGILRAGRMPVRFVADPALRAANG